MSRSTLLVALGHPIELERLYQRLRPLSGRSVDRIAADMLRTREELLDEVTPLIDAGVVRVVDSRLEVAPPIEVLRGVVETQAAYAGRAERLLVGVGQAIDVLADEQHLSSSKGDAITDALPGEIWIGGDLFGRVRSMMLDNDGDVAWLRPDQWRGPREERMVGLIAEVVARGRRSRAIYPVRALHDAPDVLAARVRAGEQIRVLPEIPTRMLIVGDRHAVLPEPLGLADLPLSVMRQRGVVEVMQMWFDELWGRAAVPTLDDAAPRVDLRRFLLEQLAGGVHDEQIARKLGLSLRTVRRRVATLMTELGADSRFQAGVEAARRGWL